MEFLGAIIETGKNVLEATGKWVVNINSLDANMKNLKRKIEYLSCQEDDINTELRSAERSLKRRRKEVQVWLRDVKTLRGDVLTLQRLEEEVVGWKYVFSRARLGLRVMEKIQEVEELQVKGRFSNGLLIDALPTTSETTSERNMRKVWEYLMDDEVGRIGVFGMTGVGKTTIMKHINRRLLNETCNFDGVIWVTVSKPFNINKLQSDIAKALNLDFLDCKDETRIAPELYTILSRKERYVLILDDLWEAFSMKKVGIPEPTRSNGCKLVLTTRFFEVCKQMKCRPVKVELLTEEEALNLFMSKVEEGQPVLIPEVKEIARNFARECTGLPLAIVTLARSMRGVNDIHEWINTLNQLISSTKQISDIENVVFELLKFCYSRLKDEKLQYCFLYCALYPRDHIIPRKELIEYWISEGLIAEANSIEAMFNSGHAILNKLVNTCLLESAKIHRTECVRMHDLIRDMALKITQTSPRFMVQSGEGLERVSYTNWSEELETVSLMYNMIKELTFKPPICHRLTTLLLGHIPLRKISDSFFTPMHHLKMLDLSNTYIQYLPEAVSNLVNLHALLLVNCVCLEHVPSLVKLKALKEFKLNRSLIGEVPQGMEELVNLRNLDLSFNKSLHMLPCWNLCGLSQLQILRIEGSGAFVSAQEVFGYLTQLKVLGAQFLNVQELTSYVTSQQCQTLEDYRLMVGNNFEYINNSVGKEVHVIGFDSKPFGSGVDSLVLPSNIEYFGITRCEDLISLSDILSLRDAGHLRICLLQYCNGIECIFSSSFFSEDCQIPLRIVEELRLLDLPRFRVLFDGVVPPHNISFNLKKLYIYRCSSVKNIFPAMLLQNFPNLEELTVSDCENVEEIIVEVEMRYQGHHQDDGNIITLRNLKSLRLGKLPILKNIYKGIMVCESLQDILVHSCPMLRRLPLSFHMNSGHASTPPGQHIRGDEEWWEYLQWDDPHTKTTLQPLFVPVHEVNIIISCRIKNLANYIQINT
ncbi:hypothetical protein ACSBR2_018997 [Camellia fascicularis]